MKTATNLKVPEIERSKGTASSASSTHERLLVKKPPFSTRLVRSKAGDISAKDQALLWTLTTRRKSAINFKDIPNTKVNTFENKSGLGDLFRPIKKQVTLRLDGDVLAWARKNGAGYQSRINAALRKVMMEEILRAGKS